MKRIGKKSQHELMFIIFQLMMIATIFASLMFYVGTLKEQTLFKKLALSRDLALTVNTLYSAPGNIEYTYYAADLNISKFDYRFNEQLVNVLEQGRPTSYPYGDDLLFQLSFPTIKESNQIQFQNIDYRFLAKKEIESKPNLFKFPYVEIKETRGKIMVGFYGDENLLAKVIAVVLNAGKEGVSRIKKADMLIIAEIDNQTSKTLKIEIPINPEFIKQNRKLASLIMNNALEKGNIERALIVPSTRAGLNKINISVFIVKSEDVPITDISQTISNSVNQYYGS